MKIRNGFVSNSSSSSFIILGIQLNDEQKNLLREKNNIDYIGEIVEENNLDYIAEGDFNDVCGINISTTDECDELEKNEISFENLDEKAKEIINKFQNIGINLTKSDIKIFTGTQLY